MYVYTDRVIDGEVNRQARQIGIFLHLDGRGGGQATSLPRSYLHDVVARRAGWIERAAFSIRLMGHFARIVIFPSKYVIGRFDIGRSRYEWRQIGIVVSAYFLNISHFKSLSWDKNQNACQCRNVCLLNSVIGKHLIRYNHTYICARAWVLAIFWLARSTFYTILLLFSQYMRN